MKKTYVYIDGANLHQWSKPWGWIDYARFKRWLTDKYKAEKIFLFMWYVKGNELLYSQLSGLWYALVFKETLEIAWKVKWNCDAELVVSAISNYYEQKTNRAILVTGDGDFSCLVYFFLQKHHEIIILAPSKDYCSYLLKKTNAPLVFLENIQSKLKKTPSKDGTLPGLFYLVKIL